MNFFWNMLGINHLSANVEIFTKKLKVCYKLKFKEIPSFFFLALQFFFDKILYSQNSKNIYFSLI
ncbi:hypothetical protein BpHYR1_033551 [Brachionus plicatilis]|uniref:Uncharacterized protein n=1 Tax=Brachionus plicatilis TaxID=10195 RepID=A0A3M7T308_BRAPC|nr:hypothetical protein BpHYR1_033551 [Brachionus plicatilis]